MSWHGNNSYCTSPHVHVQWQTALLPRDLAVALWPELLLSSLSLEPELQSLESAPNLQTLFLVPPPQPPTGLHRCCYTVVLLLQLYQNLVTSCKTGFATSCICLQEAQSQSQQSRECLALDVFIVICGGNLDMSCCN